MDPENQSLNETLTIYSLLSLLFFWFENFGRKIPAESLTPYEARTMHDANGAPPM